MGGSLRPRQGLGGACCEEGSQGEGPCQVGKGGPFGMLGEAWDFGCFVKYLNRWAGDMVDVFK